MAEQVLVFSEEILKPYLPLFKNGIIVDYGSYEGLLNECFSNSFYMDRDSAETNPACKQIIPYAVLEKDGKYYVYQRSKKGKEKRLHSRWSLGVGGHINPVDGVSREAYHNALWRELKEEVSLTPGCYPVTRPLGVIYSPVDAVGSVHFGVAILLYLDKDMTPKLADAAMRLDGFLKLDDIKSQLDQFENWSQLVISNMLP